MFDIGFFELILVAIVGLLVIGPERLPETVRTLALWLGRLRRTLRETRAELEKQVGADDIRRQLHNEEIMRSLNATREDIERAVNEEPAAPPISESAPQHPPSPASPSTENREEGVTPSSASDKSATDKL